MILLELEFIKISCNIGIINDATTQQLYYPENSILQNGKHLISVIILEYRCATGLKTLQIM